MRKAARTKRSLYQCFNTQVRAAKIYCAKGWPLGVRKDGTLDVLRRMRGDPLVCSGCHDCADFDSTEGPVAAKDRGWLGEEVKQW